MKQMMRRIGWTGILWLLPIAGWAQSTTTVQMAGYHHVPAVETPASGVLEVTLKADTLIVEGEFRDLTSVYRSSALYFGEPGKRGNRLMGLKAELNEDRTGGEFSAEENRLVLRPSLLQALERGHLFVNVGSDRRPHKKIRGQIPPMVSSPDQAGSRE
ncbi:MAG: CHRD domain-containing protein [Bacteroidota bacterium]